MVKRNGDHNTEKDPQNGSDRRSQKVINAPGIGDNWLRDDRVPRSVQEADAERIPSMFELMERRSVQSGKCLRLNDPQVHKN